jgi:predicted Zn finger-like uncharacterized protein
MDIVCPQCKTEYEFEDEKVTPSGITVKCTNCNYTFKVRRKAVVETEPVETPAPGPRERPPTRQWMIRSTGGDVFKFKELTKLQQWIVERKVTRDDQISRSGETWKRLGDIAELASFFQVVDAAMAAEDPDPETTRRAPTNDSGPYEAPSAYAASDEPLAEPAFAADADQFRTVGPSAAWEEGGDQVGEVVEEEIPRRQSGKVVGIAVVVLVLIGAGVAGVLARDKLGSLFNSNSDRSDQSYQAGRKLFLQDAPGSLKLADQRLAQAPPDNALALAARAEVHTTWAQHLRQEGTILEHKARRIEAVTAAARAREKQGDKAPQGKAAPAAPAGDPSALRLEASNLREQASKKLLQAEAFASQALKKGEDKAEINRAMADYLRLAGRDRQQVEQYLQRARELEPDDPETLYVEGALAADQDEAERAERLLRQSLAKTKARYGAMLLRAAFHLATLQLSNEDYHSARAQAQMILDENPAHRWAQMLRDEATASAAAAESAVAAGDDESSGDAEEKPEDEKVAQRDDGDAAESDRGGDEEGKGFRGNYDALIERGNKLSERGRTMQALKVFERALKKNSTGPEALTGIGYCHLDQERFASAMSYFKRAMRIDPTHGEALIGMAEAYKVQGNDVKALDYYKAYLRTSPGGSKAIMARRNVTDIEQKLGTSSPPTPQPQPAPAPAPAPSPSPSAPETESASASPEAIPDESVPDVPGGAE